MSHPNAALFAPEALAVPHRTRRARLEELLMTAVALTTGLDGEAETEADQPASVKIARLAAEALRRMTHTSDIQVILGDLRRVLEEIPRDEPWLSDPLWADLRAFV